MNIALITPENKTDYLANSVIDGLLRLSRNGEVNFKVTGNYSAPFDLTSHWIKETDFIEFGVTADLVILMDGKLGANMQLAERINCFDKTIFVDGSEVGKNLRFDYEVQNQIINGTYKGWGRIHQDMAERCTVYFRREKPYVDGIIPFPLSIPSVIADQYDPAVVKDIDFVCIFGQDEYPLMRRFAKELTKKYCEKNGFTCLVEPTPGFKSDDKDRTSGREEFYKILARAKVGISVGGGGFDTMRFWEILGSNCMLISENIDIYQPDSFALSYDRIFEFSNLYDYIYQLEKVGTLLKNHYNQSALLIEYKDIMSTHSAEARVRQLIDVSMSSIQR